MTESSGNGKFLEVAEGAARAAGEVLKKWLGHIRVREKAPKDLVTEADIESQSVIQRWLLDVFPDHGFVGEEQDALPRLAPDAELRWIVDPLDGTTNFVHQLPNFAVSIALERQGEVIVGVIFDPLANEMYSASIAGGARMNGERLSASGCESLEQSLIAASFSAGVTRDSDEVARFVEVLVSAQAVRRMGSAALNLCYVASGRLDGYWASSVKMWDVAAGALILREAGGVIRHLDGTEFRLEDPQFLAAATPSLWQQLWAKLS